MTIYERIQLLAQSKNISIRVLETSLGFSNGTLRQWGNSAKSSSLEKVADYFDVTTDHLLGRDNSSQPLTSDKLVSRLTYNGKPLTDRQKRVLSALIDAYLDTDNQ